MNPSGDGVTCSSPKLFRHLTRDETELPKPNRDGADVREKSPNRLKTMTTYQKTVLAAFGSVTALFTTAIGAAALIQAVAIAAA